MGEATVADVQAVLDNLNISSRRKLETVEVSPNDNPEYLLRSLLSQEILESPVAYKVLQALITFLKDGFLEQSGQLVFDTMEEMFTRSEAADLSPRQKTVLQEIAAGLFSHACSVLQSNSHLTVPYLHYLLNAMLREGTPKWNAYSCVGPLLMTRLEAFQPHAGVLLQTMLSFPETLAVIHELYQLAPSAFVENMSTLVKLYESNFNGQLSILDIVRDLAKQHPEVVAPHLAALQQIASGAGENDEVVVKEIETTVVNARVPPPPTEEEPIPTIPSSPPGSPEPEDFDERVAFYNQLASECRDLESLREFLKENAHYANRYLRHVGQVMPLPVVLDCTGLRTPENPEGSNDSVTLHFQCANGPRCALRAPPNLVKSSTPSPWLKLFAVLSSRSPPDPSFAVQFRRGEPANPLAALVAASRLVEKEKGVEGEGEKEEKAGGEIGILARPFLGTDDLADLIVDLRFDGLFKLFHYDVAANIWTCSECSAEGGSGVQKANMSGYLMKKGRRLGREVKRFYMLDEAHFFYATHERRSKTKRRIPVSEIVSVKETGDIFEIAVRKQKRAITLRSTSLEETQKWMRAIETVIMKPPSSPKV